MRTHDPRGSTSGVVRWRLAALAAPTLWLVTACTGIVSVPEETDSENGPARCAVDEILPSSAPLRRLTPEEYANTVDDLFEGVPVEAVTLSPSAAGSGFRNDATTQGAGTAVVEELNAAAETIASPLVAQQATWLGCEGSGASCRDALLDDFLMRAFRRPVTATERADFGGFLDGANDEFGWDVAVRMFVEAVLQAPEFLYRAELGTDQPAPPGYRQLSGYEVASRLSYFLWRTMPDDRLFEDAAAGRLDSPEGLETATRRMLEDPRSHETVADFHRQWLDLERTEVLQVSSERHPELTDSARAALPASFSAWLERIFWEEGTVDALFTDSHLYVNDELATLYELDPPGSTELTWVQADPAQRSGVLTQPALLASTSHGTVHSPIFRGVSVQRSFLCATPPVPDMIPPFDGDTTATGETTRQRVESMHSGQPACAGCHHAIDGLGFSFEQYDLLGRFRTEENGIPVDPTGLLVDTWDVNGPVANGVELSRRLGQSEQVSACIADHWLRYAVGRPTDRGDRCQVGALGAALHETGDLQGLLIDIVKSPSFRLRPEIAP